MANLTNEDVDFLTELVESEIARVVDEKIAELRTEVAQTFINLALKQCEMFGLEFTPMDGGGKPPAPPTGANGHVPHGD